MSVTISAYPDVQARVEELGLKEPTGLALLPANFLEAASRDELLQQDHTPTVRSLWRQNGVVESRLEPDDMRIPSLAQRGFEEWVAPTIFIASSLMSQNPTAVTVALNVLSNYLTEILQSFPKKQVQLNIVEQCPDGDSGMRYREVKYVGDVAGLAELPAVLHEVYTHGE